MSTTQIPLILLTVYTLLVLIRVLLGPTIWDRLLGLNMITAKIIMAIVFLSVISKKTYLMDIALVYSILGFIGTVLIAQFIEMKGRI